MNFANTTPHTVFYQASALIAYNNPSMCANEIIIMLNALTKDEKHSVRLGVLKAHKKLGLVKGYAQTAVAG